MQTIPQVYTSSMLQTYVQHVIRGTWQPIADGFLTSKRLEIQFGFNEETFLYTWYLVLGDPGAVSHDGTKK